MAHITIKLSDEQIDGVDTVRFNIEHDINVAPEDGNLSPTPAMLAAVHLVKAFQEGSKPPPPKEA